MDANEYIDKELYRVYTLGDMRKVDEPKSANITVKTPESFKDLLQEVADKNDRTLSQTAYFLIQRGLELYMKDGILRPREEKLVSVRASVAHDGKEEDLPTNHKKESKKKQG